VLRSPLHYVSEHVFTYDTSPVLINKTSLVSCVVFMYGHTPLYLKFLQPGQGSGLIRIFWILYSSYLPESVQNISPVHYLTIYHSHTGSKLSARSLPLTPACPGTKMKQIVFSKVILFFSLVLLKDLNHSLRDIQKLINLVQCKCLPDCFLNALHYYGSGFGRALVKLWISNTTSDKRNQAAQGCIFLAISW
jgi:hypothetical protein